MTELPDQVEKLFEDSSLGTAEVRHLSARTSPAVVEKILDRVATVCAESTADTASTEEAASSPKYRPAALTDVAKKKRGFFFKMLGGGVITGAAAAGAKYFGDPKQGDACRVAKKKRGFFFKMLRGGVVTAAVAAGAKYFGDPKRQGRDRRGQAEDPRRKKIKGQVKIAVDKQKAAIENKTSKSK